MTARRDSYLELLSELGEAPWEVLSGFKFYHVKLKFHIVVNILEAHIVQLHTDKWRPEKSLHDEADIQNFADIIAFFKSTKDEYT